MGKLYYFAEGRPKKKAPALASTEASYSNSSSIVPPLVRFARVVRTPDENRQLQDMLQRLLGVA